MTQETKQTDGKEVLQSYELIKEYNARQELYLGNGTALKSYVFATNDETGLKITVESEYREDNFYHLPFAKLIIEAVNERQRLLDSNRELLDAAKITNDRLIQLMGESGWALSPFGSVWKEHEALQTAINNAKNISHD